MISSAAQILFRSNFLCDLKLLAKFWNPKSIQFEEAKLQNFDGHTDTHTDRPTDILAFYIR